MREAIRWALLLYAIAHVAVQVGSAWEVAHRTPRGAPVRQRWWAQRHAGLIRAPGDARLTGSPSLTGCLLAVVAPLAPWPLWPVFALGLYLSGSWLAIGALAGAYALTGAVGR